MRRSCRGRCLYKHHLAVLVCCCCCIWMDSNIQSHLKNRLVNFLRVRVRVRLLLHQRNNTMMTTSLSSLKNRHQLLQIRAQLITTRGVGGDQSSVHSLLHVCLSNPATLIFNRRLHQAAGIDKWHVIIRQHASGRNPDQSLALFRKKTREYGNLFYPDPFVCASVIKACSRLMAMREGRSVHGQVLRLGLDAHLNVHNTLIHFYLNYSTNTNSKIHKACILFDRIPHTTVVTVNCMISGLLKKKLFHMGCSLFNRVLDGSIVPGDGLRPNDVTLVILVSGCAEFRNLGMGRSLHSYCCKTLVGLASSVCNALIYLYAKFGHLDDAVALFEEMPYRDLVSWNTLIAGYCKNNDSDKAISVFMEMKYRDIEGDQVTWVSLISACGHSRDLKMGRWIHSHLKRRAIVVNLSIATALINMYSKCGLIEIAREVFNEMSIRNIVSWNSMILGYVECGCFAQAFSLFDLIKSEQLKPDEVTMLGLISACRNSGALNHGRQIHSYIESSGLHRRTVLCNAIIDMYAKCGSMNGARRVFDQMPERDVISWTSMIVGHAINGEGKEAVLAFQKMCAAGVEPNGITFIGVLCACDHAGLVEDGRNLYQIMCEEYSIEPEIEHCGCMVDMLARAGLLDEAYDFVKSMPVQPNAVIWRMLISACRIHGDVDLGATLVNGLLEFKKFHDPEDYVISSNIYATAGRWNDAMHARQLMYTQKFPKTPGRSLIS